MTVPVPILTYHSMHVDSPTYAGNDHVALAEDLRSIHALGGRIIPLAEAFAWHQGQRPASTVERAVVLTFDDGSWWDFHDLDHPAHGRQRSLFNILRDFRAEAGVGAQPGLHASAFVIASPGAREELDRKAMIGRGWWSDDWWARAQQSGLLAIECHSWDHVHPLLETVAQREQRKGDFAAVDSPEDCRAQVAQAGAYIRERAGPDAARFFAYPWGQASAYLASDYLPRRRARHGFQAALTTDPRPLRRSDDRWRLPRVVCGRDWRCADEFRDVLERWWSAPGA